MTALCTPRCSGYLVSGEECTGPHDADGYPLPGHPEPAEDRPAAASLGGNSAPKALTTDGQITVWPADVRPAPRPAVCAHPLDPDVPSYLCLAPLPCRRHPGQPVRAVRITVGSQRVNIETGGIYFLRRPGSLPA